MTKRQYSKSSEYVNLGPYDSHWLYRVVDKSGRVILETRNESLAVKLVEYMNLAYGEGRLSRKGRAGR